MPEPADYSPLLPQPFPGMQEGYDDPEEVKAVQRFLLRVGGPSIAMRLMPGGANGKFDKRMANAIEAYQDKFGIEVPQGSKGVLDVTTSRHMSELRGELGTHDRRPDVVEHLLSQMPPLPRHPLEGGMGAQADLRSAQLHAVDAASRMKPQRPDKHVTEFVQEVLASRGYSLGPAGVDGKPGKFTLAALQDYQRDAGLKPVGFLKDGSLDPATLEMMRMDEEAMQRRTMMQQPRIDVPDPAPSGSIGGLSSLSGMLGPEVSSVDMPQMMPTEIIDGSSRRVTSVTVGEPVAAGPDPADAAAALVADPGAAAPAAPAGPAQWDPNAYVPPPEVLAAADTRGKYSGPATLPGRAYQTPQQAGFQGNVSIHVGPVVEQGMFGRTVKQGMRIKIF